MSEELAQPRATIELTPMLRHYMELKASHPDALLLYRMGDFYEAFFDDALRIAPILEITLTARHRGTDSETPMCGVPHHALEPYLAKLLRAGQKVAICDQMEDPAQAKGLVRREITRVMTPGTLSDPGLLDSREESLLVALVAAAAGSPAGEADSLAAAVLDTSTGTLVVRRFRDAEACREELQALRVRELVVPEAGASGALAAVVEWARGSGLCVSSVDGETWPEIRDAADRLRRRFGVSTLRGFGLADDEPAVVAAAAALE